MEDRGTGGGFKRREELGIFGFLSAFLDVLHLRALHLRRPSNRDSLSGNFISTRYMDIGFFR